jgi:signal transduction histidine kinase
MKARTDGRLAWGLWALYFPLAVATKLLEAPSGELFGSMVESVALFGAFAVIATVGALIGARRPENPIGWLLLAVALGVAFTAFAGAYATYALITRPGSLPGGELMAWFQSWTWYPSIGLLITFLILLFPTGRLASPRWKPLAWADGIQIALLVLAAALAPAIEIGGEGEGHRIVLDNPIGLEAARGALDFLEGAVGLVFLALIVLGVISVFVRYRNAAHDERQQLKWFLYAVALNVLGGVVGELAPEWAGGNVVFAVLVSLIPISIAVAVLKHRLYDIDVVINKTLVYGALAALITAIYVGVVVGLGSGVANRGEPNLGLQIAATALVALVFQPARHRVQRLANRLVYGSRAEPYEVMADFADRMAGSIEIKEVLPRTAEAAARGVGAAQARVRMFLPDGTRREAHWPDEGQERPTFDLAFPVTHQGEEVGEIAVAKPAGDPVRPAEELLLRDLASQAGLALHNVRLTSELALQLDEISRQAAELHDSRARIVTAADDERRRLERIIEDRVERRLQEMAATLRKETAGPGSQADDVVARLERLRGEAQETLEELREIARGIYPPLLADQGLAAALEAQVRKTGRSMGLSVDGLGRYPEEVEAGAYFCCLEAMAGADGDLSLAVREVAEGIQLAIEGELPDDVLTRIRDRVEALGGTVTAGRQQVSARIPVKVKEVVA